MAEDLVKAQADIGCADEYGAWWVPDVHLEASPIYLALRATMMSKAEYDERRLVDADTVLKEPIAREAEVRSWMVSILHRHLDGYACKAEQAANELRKGAASSLSPAEEAATRLVHFEQGLLRAQISGLQPA